MGPPALRRPCRPSGGMFFFFCAWKCPARLAPRAIQDTGHLHLGLVSAEWPHAWRGLKGREKWEDPWEGTCSLEQVPSTNNHLPLSLSLSCAFFSGIALLCQARLQRASRPEHATRTFSSNLGGRVSYFGCSGTSVQTCHEMVFWKDTEPSHTSWLFMSTCLYEVSQIPSLTLAAFLPLSQHENRTAHAYSVLLPTANFSPRHRHLPSPSTPPSTLHPPRC